MRFSVCCRLFPRSVRVADFIRMKNYQLQLSDSNDESGPTKGADYKGAPDHSPDLPYPVGIDFHPDIFDAVELKQQKRAKDATVERRFQEQSSGDVVSWAEAYLDKEKNLLVIEETSNVFDAVYKLSEAGFTCVVVDSTQTEKVSETFIDNDQIAAERIVRCYLTGFAKVVWVPDPRTIELRELLHAYQNSVTDHVRATNELKSFLTVRNIRPGKRNLHLDKNRKWVEDKVELSPIQQSILDDLFANLHHTKALKDRYYRMICEEMLDHKDMLNCLRVLGIGLINAFAIVAIVGDIKRFSTAKKLVSYLGLNPGRKKSGKGKDKKKGTGNRGRSDMRALLIQAAQCVLNNSAKKNNKIGKWGFKLFARTGKRNLAVVAIARKLTHALYHILSGRVCNMLEQEEPMKRKFYKISATIGADVRKEMGFNKSAEFVEMLCQKVQPNTPPPTQ